LEHQASPDRPIQEDTTPEARRQRHEGRRQGGVPDIIWHCRNNVFASTLRVFDLKGYDIVLGMDWLESCGDMWVSWERKSLRFRHNGTHHS
jgi:hypothetical protein